MKDNKLWILFDHTGNVKITFCSCTSGTSSCCNHTVAALYKIDYANQDCTDPFFSEKLCGWDKSLKEIKQMKRDTGIQEHYQ